MNPNLSTFNFAICVCGLLATSLFGSPPPGELHDTPDGFVERAVAIVIKGRTVELTIQIGINAQTMRDQFAEWQVEGEFETETELTNRFCDEIQQRLLPQFQLKLEDQDMDLQIASVEPFAEHHKTAVMKVTAQIPDDVDTAKLTLTDTSFLNFDGAVRYAIKGRGSTLVTQSNAAPIIIRADRIELGSLSKQERDETCRLEARVKIVSR